MADYVISDSADATGEDIEQDEAHGDGDAATAEHVLCEDEAQAQREADQRDQCSSPEARLDRVAWRRTLPTLARALRARCGRER